MSMCPYAFVVLVSLCMRTQAGASPLDRVEPDGPTAAHFAADMRAPGIVELLAASGADVFDARDARSGLTVVDVLDRSGQCDTASRLRRLRATGVLVPMSSLGAGAQPGRLAQGRLAVNLAPPPPPPPVALPVRPSARAAPAMPTVTTRVEEQFDAAGARMTTRITHEIVLVENGPPLQARAALPSTAATGRVTFKPMLPAEAIRSGRCSVLQASHDVCARAARFADEFRGEWPTLRPFSLAIVPVPALSASGAARGARQDQLAHWAAASAVDVAGESVRAVERALPAAALRAEIVFVGADAQALLDETHPRLVRSLRHYRPWTARAPSLGRIASGVGVVSPDVSALAVVLL